MLILTACQNHDGMPPGYQDQFTPAIQLNQVGYYPDQRISFTYADTGGTAGGDPRPVQRFFITSLDGDTTIREGTAGEVHDWRELAGVQAQAFTTDPLPVGEYRIYIPDRGYSQPFRVAEHVLRAPLRASVKALYYQRASQALDKAYAGQYARAAGHPDTGALYHPSSGREGGTMRSPGGWYDAGDYNKYIVNGAFPVGQLLTLYEDTGDPAPDGTLNLPESGNGKSDYLDELKYELDWMLTMQDDDDDGGGGVYHKLTTLAFEPMVPPAEATSPRYVVGKSSTATFDFAAAAAQAARVYQDYDATYANRLLAAARLAWRWGLEHPAAYFRNPPDVSTGEYGDDDATDERAWAAAELFATTGEQEFLNELQARPPRVRLGGGWTSYMGNLAAFTLLRFPDRVPQEMHRELAMLVTTLADSIVIDIDSGAYRQPLRNFGWGSNSDVLNAAMFLAAAHLQEPEEKYLDAMYDCLNYLLGNNPNNVCYLTGFGTHSPQHIHHRPSIADGVDAPVPGLLSGGPNSAQQDRAYATYPPDVTPLRSWVDQEGSFASNEICLNWNAPFTYVTGYLEAKRPAAATK